jgi:hypothetical protein
VTSLFHVGVAVSNLEESVQVLEKYFRFTTSSRRVVEHAYIGNLINHPSAAAEIAMMDIGDGNILELLQWEVGYMSTGPTIEAKLCSPKVHHICIYVEDATEWHDRLSKVPEVKLMSTEPVDVPIGPNAGSKVFFALVLGEIFFEIFQRV